MQQLPKMAKTSTQPKHTHTTVHVRKGLSRTTTFTIPMPPRGTIFFCFGTKWGRLIFNRQVVHVSTWEHEYGGASWEVHVSAPLDCPIVFDRRLRGSLYGLYAQIIEPWQLFVCVTNKRPKDFRYVSEFFFFTFFFTNFFSLVLGKQVGEIIVSLLFYCYLFVIRGWFGFLFSILMGLLGVIQSNHVKSIPIENLAEGKPFWHLI